MAPTAPGATASPWTRDTYKQYKREKKLSKLLSGRKYLKKSSKYAHLRRKLAKYSRKSAAKRKLSRGSTYHKLLRDRAIRKLSKKYYY